jgi:hypothetical protein
MNALSNQNFGLIIAYLLPGFVSLWGVSYFSPTVESWINVHQQPGSPSVAGFMYVTLASLAAGVTVSAVRWALIDHLHHATGIVPPVWKFAHLEGKLQGYLTLIENHYRYYQFYANMFVAAAFAYWARLFSEGPAFPRPITATCGFLALEMILFAGSRDTLQKYYSRTQQLLNSRHP